MDHRPKCKMQNIGENLDALGHNDEFLDTTPNAESPKERINKLGSLKLNFSALQNTMSRE